MGSIRWSVHNYGSVPSGRGYLGLPWSGKAGESHPVSFWGPMRSAAVFCQTPPCYRLDARTVISTRIVGLHWRSISRIEWFLFVRRIGIVHRITAVRSRLTAAAPLQLSCYQPANYPVVFCCKIQRFITEKWKICTFIITMMNNCPCIITCRRVNVLRRFCT